MSPESVSLKLDPQCLSVGEKQATYSKVIRAAVATFVAGVI